MMKTTFLFSVMTLLQLYCFSQPCPANAGPDRIICEDGTGTLGTPASSGHVYRWSPSTGLSSSIIAQPTVTAGSTSVTYTLTVSGRGCVTRTSQVVVNVPTTDIITAFTGKDGFDQFPPPLTVDYYYWYESSEGFTMTSHSPVGNVWKDTYILNGNQTINYGYGQTYSVSFTGLNTAYHGIQLGIYDDHGNQCQGSEIWKTVDIYGHGCNNNSQYPSGTSPGWYCASSLPATIYQPNMGTDGVYHWGFGRNPSDWQFSNASGNSAQLNVPNPAGCSDPGYCAETGWVYVWGYNQHWITNYGWNGLVPWEEVISSYGVGRTPGCKTTSTTLPQPPLSIYKTPFQRYTLAPLPRKINYPGSVISTNPVISTDMVLSPNPSNQMVRIITDDPIQAIELHDANGRIIKQVNGNGTNRCEIITYDLMNGIYFCTIRTKKESISRILIVRH